MLHYTINLQKKLSPLKEALSTHRLYQDITTVDDLQIFMEHHVYAVWDFMSLLKFLQNKLTCNTLPWIPTDKPTLTRFINEIVLAEESDIDLNGKVNSHFGMYLDAMKEVGANTDNVISFITQLKTYSSIKEVLVNSNLPQSVIDFCGYTFELINSDKPHLVAAAFTFGREDLIPEMFSGIISNEKGSNNPAFSKFNYYLNRHIELDGDDHGPLSIKLVEELCKADTNKWAEVEEVAIVSLQKRIQLWNDISSVIRSIKRTDDLLSNVEND